MCKSDGSDGGQGDEALPFEGCDPEAHGPGRGQTDNAAHLRASGGDGGKRGPPQRPLSGRRNTRALRGRGPVGQHPDSTSTGRKSFWARPGAPSASQAPPASTTKEAKVCTGESEFLIVPASFISVRHSSGGGIAVHEATVAQVEVPSSRPPSSYKITKSTVWSAARAPGASPSPSL